MALAAASPAAATGVAASATAPRCAAASLLIWAGPATGAAGSVDAEYGFTDHSASSCSLYGYPIVQMLNKSGTDLATFDQKAPGAFSIKEETVVLAPGKTAYFGVVYASSTGYANLTCPTSAALRFTPPQNTGTVTLHGSHAKITPFGGSTEHLKCGILHVTPVTAKRFQ
jgi:hypothetical protein